MEPDRPTRERRNWLLVVGVLEAAALAGGCEDHSETQSLNRVSLLLDGQINVPRSGDGHGETALILAYRDKVAIRTAALIGTWLSAMNICKGFFRMPHSVLGAVVVVTECEL